jgi:predicted tellurium resistance membrane protein TerC
MRGAGYGVLVLGIIVAVLGLVNHYVLKANPVAHTSTIVIGVGVVLAVIGVAMSFMGGRDAA